MEKEIITSKNNPLAVRLAKLQQKKYRELEGLFVLDGEKLFSEALAYGAEIEYVVLSESYYNEKISFVRAALKSTDRDDICIIPVADSVFEKITSEKSPQGIITVAKTIDFFEKYTTIYNNEKFFAKPKYTVMLCDMQDPGNLGTALRSACAFELDAVYVANGCADLFSPKTVRGSMGALFKAPICSGFDAVEQIKALRSCKVRVYAAALDRDAASLDKLEVSEDESVCFVIGNEGHGLGDDIIAECDRSVFIPMAQNTESLNASIASSILMWELFKRKLFYRKRK
ncbi:MAG: RNA methyltransferase [Clostridia bacterium]|nr:RNA methyltransferase [Clostridia bacterium]